MKRFMQQKIVDEIELAYTKVIFSIFYNVPLGKIPQFTCKIKGKR